RLRPGVRERSRSIGRLENHAAKLLELCGEKGARTDVRINEQDDVGWLAHGSLRIGDDADTDLESTVTCGVSARRLMKGAAPRSARQLDVMYLRAREPAVT